MRNNNIHWFAYLKDAPEYGHHPNKTVANYYDQIISCSSYVPQETNSTLNMSFTDIQRPVVLEIFTNVDSLSLYHQCKTLTYWNQLNANHWRKRLIQSKSGEKSKGI